MSTNPSAVRQPNGRSVDVIAAMGHANQCCATCVFWLWGNRYYLYKGVCTYPNGGRLSAEDRDAVPLALWGGAPVDGNQIGCRVRVSGVHPSDIANGYRSDTGDFVDVSYDRFG